MNFKNTYIRLKDSDKTVDRIKEIADKYSRASGCKLGQYLRNFRQGNVLEWGFMQIDNSNKVNVEDYLFDDRLQEIAEQDLENYLSTQLPNKEEDAKECCEGGQVSAGCFHDHCEDVVKAGENDVLNDVNKWGCFKKVADVLGDEDAEFELNKVKMKHLDGCEELKLNVFSDDLLHSFKWKNSPQGSTFWYHIDDRKLPKEYKQKPFKPTLTIDDDVLKRIKGTFSDCDDEDDDNLSINNEDSIGSLVEKLYTLLSPSNITISANGAGQILISGDKIPTVDVTKLEADEITKAYEAMVMLEGLFVEYNGE